MKYILYLATLLCGLLTTGCVSILGPVPLDKSFWKTTDSTIGVGMTALPRARTVKSGNQGLLEMAVNEAMASDLDSHLNALDLSRFKQMKQTFREELAGNGFSVKDVKDPIGLETLVDFEGPSEEVPYTNKDFRPLKQTLGVDRLLLLDVTFVGTMRDYYGFVPLGAPTVHCSAQGTLIDLSNNRVLWHHVEIMMDSIPDPWDDAPSFPNLTQTLGKAMKTVQTNMPRAFFPDGLKGKGKAVEPVQSDASPAPPTPPAPPDAFGFVFGASKTDVAAGSASWSSSPERAVTMSIVGAPLPEPSTIHAKITRLRPKT